MISLQCVGKKNEEGFETIILDQKITLSIAFTKIINWYRNGMLMNMWNESKLMTYFVSFQK